MSFRYMPKQKAFIVEHYFCSSSYTTVKIPFQQEFLKITIPTDSTIKRIVDKFRMEYILSSLLRVGQSLALTVEEKLQLCE